MTTKEEKEMLDEMIKKLKPNIHEYVLSKERKALDKMIRDRMR